jgi:hypothetical protein
VRAALLAAALLVAIAPAATAVVCQRRNATLVLRDACRKRETAVDLAQLGYRGPQGPPGRGVRLVDGAGNTVPGVVAPIGEGVEFTYRAGARVLSSEVDGNGFPSRVQFVHDEPGCAGPRFRRQDPRRLVRFAGVADGVAYFADDPIESRAVVSVEESGFAAADCTSAGGTVLANGFCCFASSSPVQAPAGPVATFDLSTLGVVPPFRLEITR